VKNYVIFSLRSKTGKFEAKQFVIFLLDAKQEKKPIEAKKYTLFCSLSKKIEAKRSEKTFICFQKEIACETDLVSLCFALKQ
jgi:hypothetical protein